MPGRTGVELAEQITKILPGVKTLYISGYAERAIIQKGLLDQHMEFLGKPFSPSKLALRVREILNKRST